jgi:hypothetical protein
LQEAAADACSALLALDRRALQEAAADACSALLAEHFAATSGLKAFDSGAALIRGAWGNSCE